jgi:cysteinyl-tRNA synthetase
MDDDFNTPEAVAVLFDLASEVNRTGSLADMALLKSMGGLLGLLQRDPQQHLQDESLAGDAKFTPERIEEMIQQRLSARAARNFAEADRIRKDLSDADILLEDGPDGTSWRRK